MPAKIGHVVSPETRSKISFALRGNSNSRDTCFKPGHQHSQETIVKMAASHRGHRASPETRAKLSLIRRGRSGHIPNEETRVKMRAAKAGEKNNRWGIHHTAEARAKIGAGNAGENSPNWKGGITKERIKIEAKPEYRSWRLAVFSRDNYTCQYCFERGGFIHAHHIKSFSQYSELRLDLSNGLTLCQDCHMRLHGLATQEVG